MNHPLREYARQMFANKLGTGAISRNAEISVLNWTVQTTRRTSKEASWENHVFRSFYKQKLHWLLKEMDRGEKVLTTIIVDGDRIQLKCTVEPQLIARLKRKELDVKNLANYSSEILWPDGPYSHTMFKAREKDLRMEQAKAQEKEYEGLFKCGKCKSTKTTYYQMQTRSADEPMVCFPLYLFFLSRD